MPIEIRRFYGMPPSRPSLHCLALQEDSVFADFDIDSEGRVFLVRISFDGYGCCTTAENIRPMNIDLSRSWLELIETDRVQSEEMAAILSQYFFANKDIIWADALEEHGLLPG